MEQTHPKVQHDLTMTNCMECKKPVYIQKAFPRLCGSCILKVKTEREQLIEENTTLKRRHTNKYAEKLESDVTHLIGALNKLIQRLRDQGTVVPSLAIEEAEKIITVAKTTCAFPGTHPHGCTCLFSQA